MAPAIPSMNRVFVALPLTAVIHTRDVYTPSATSSESNRFVTMFVNARYWSVASSGFRTSGRFVG